MGERVFSTENRTDFEDALEVSHHAHLLVKLRRLGEAGLAVEVAEVEDVGATFRAATDQLRGVDLNEVLVDAKLAEQVADTRGELEDCLLGSGAQVNYTVVQTGLHFDNGWLFLLLFLLRFFLTFFFLFLRLLLFLFFLALFTLSAFSFHFTLNLHFAFSLHLSHFSFSFGSSLHFRFFCFRLWLDLNLSFNFNCFFFLFVGIELVVVNLSAGVRDLKRESVGGPVDDKELGDLQFDLLGAALNSLFRPHNNSSQVDNAFVGHCRHVLEHFLGDGFRLEGTGLKSGEVFPQNDETVISLSSHVMHTCSYQNFLSLQLLIDFCEGQPLAAGLEGGLDEGIVSELFRLVVYVTQLLCLHAVIIIMS